MGLLPPPFPPLPPPTKPQPFLQPLPILPNIHPIFLSLISRLLGGTKFPLNPKATSIVDSCRSHASRVSAADPLFTHHCPHCSVVTFAANMSQTTAAQWVALEAKLAVDSGAVTRAAATAGVAGLGIFPRRC